MSNKNKKAQRAIFIIRRGTNTSWMQLDQLERSVLESGNQIGRCSQETNTTDGTGDIVDDETPAQHEKENNLHQLQTINPNR